MKTPYTELGLDEDILLLAKADPEGNAIVNIRLMHIHEKQSKEDIFD